MPSEDMMFMLANREQLESEYSGKYVAVWKKKIVAVGRSVSEIYRIVRELNLTNPLVTYIPKEGEEALLI